MRERQEQPADGDVAGTAATLPGTATALRRFERRSTASLVSETLRDSIIRGELPPGTPLREQRWPRRSTSRATPCARRFRLLSHEGLVDYHVHRGVAVRKLSSADIARPLPVARGARGHGDPLQRSAPREKLDAIERIVVEAEQALQDEDWKEVATLDILFHQQIVELIGSERISIFFRRLGAELRLVFSATLQPSQHGPFVPWNRLLVDLLRAGETEACAQEMRDYLAAAEEMIQRALADSA